MLSVMKNALLTDASKRDVNIRKMELDWFSHNCWIIATQATVVAGFTFSQLSHPGPPSGTFWPHLLQMGLTAVGFIFSLNVLVQATLSGIHAQGLALRGYKGFTDLTSAIERLRVDQDKMVRQFMISLVCFVLSSFAAVLITGKGGKASIKVQAALLFVSLALAAAAWRSISLFYHTSATAGGLSAIEGNYAHIGDLDAIVTEG